jgi:hypothetical protein
MIPKIDELTRKGFTYADALKGITYTKGNKEAKLDQVFPYIYLPIRTEQKKMLITGIFDFSTTVCVEPIEKEKENKLASTAKELVIIGPPNEGTTMGSHVNRLIRCLLNPAGDKFIFTGEGVFDISFIAISDEGKFGAYASLLLTNQLRVISADAKATNGGSITKQILENLSKEFTDFFGINSDSKPKRSEILKKANRLAIHVKTRGKSAVQNPDYIVRIIDDNPNEAKGVSLRQIGFSAALGIYFDDPKNQAPLDVRASKVKSLLTRGGWDIETFLTRLKKDGPYVAADIWSSVRSQDERSQDESS